MDPLELYTKETKVWIPDEEEVWVGGEIINVADGMLEILLEDDREVSVPISDDPKSLPPLRNPEILVGANDLTTLSYLHEAAVLHNLYVRFINYQAIYTYCGIVLVALNPYQELPLYGDDIIAAYAGQAMGEMDPHIFAVAEDAFRKMVDEHHNQSIIVSGESGAGKTVSAKYTMRYFANMGGSLTETTIERKVLASNPIMEAIGNAKTIRNDNSSRFGKYIEINFDKAYQIIGANMRTYLLEKSRVVFQAPDERNYHIFYQLCANHKSPEFQDLQMGPPEAFFYTNQGQNAYIEGVDDAEELLATREAMALLGIYHEQQRIIFQVLAAILHLGNVDIISHSKREEECSVSNTDYSLSMTAMLLGVDKSQLQKWLCNRKIVATGDVYVKPLTLNEANNGRDALAKHIYAQLFKWIVESINTNLATTIPRKSFIGVLDIYGFETFEVNSFEQFCINYANEKLQQQFNQHVFKLEQEEYVREKINWSFIDFYDNQPCIDLIEAKLGVLDLLDEECRMPRGSDGSWAQKMYKQHLKVSQHFAKPKMSDLAFIVRHYADDVIYDCESFVEKNRDTVNEEHLALLRASEYELVAELFSAAQNTALFAPRKRTSSRVGQNAPKGKKTVGSEFRDSLFKLMETLNSTTPHYVRCIKSNDYKAPFEFDPRRSVQQLRACGVLETIRISAAGYPSRWMYEEFFDRYRMLVPRKALDARNYQRSCQTILDHYIKDPDKFQLGRTKIFFPSWTDTSQHVRETKAATAIQCTFRGWSARRKYVRLRSAVVTIQAYKRGMTARRIVRVLRYEQKALFIQRVWRGYRGRHYYRRRMRAIVYLQSCVRRMHARRELKKLKIEARSVEHYKQLNKGMENKIISVQQKLNEERKEKDSLLAKVKELVSVERELAEAKNYKQLYEQSQKQMSTLENEVNTLREELAQLEKNKLAIVEEAGKRDVVYKEEIEGLKTNIQLLRKSLEDQKKRTEESTAKQEEFQARNKELTDQLGQVTADYQEEKMNHQKMVKEYDAWNSEFTNLQDELKMERSSPEKVVRRRVSSGDVLDDEVTHTIAKLKEDLFEAQRERNGLANELALLQQEKESLPTISVQSEISAENEAELLSLRQESERVMKENSSLHREIGILHELIKEDEEDNLEEKQERAFTSLLNEIHVLRAENMQLLQERNHKANREVVTMATTPVKDHPFAATGNDGVTAVEFQSLRTAYERASQELDILRKEKDKIRNDAMSIQHKIHGKGDLDRETLVELTRLMEENTELKIKLESMEQLLQESQGAGSLTSPNRSRQQARRHSGNTLLAADTAPFRRRSHTVGVRYTEDLSAGKLAIQYAGLMRKPDNEVSSKEDSPPKSSVTKPAKKLGMLEFHPGKEAELTERLITQMMPSYVEKAVPGLPAHLIFMAIRYVDYINDETVMKTLLSNVITGIKTVVKKNAGDIDMQAFWLSNLCRLLYDMKQYSGDKAFQTHNTKEQNQQCLQNFDLSEYRNVVSDSAVYTYQTMVKTIQDAIHPLIVPGMLEYESIPVTSSSKPFGRGKTKGAQNKSETQEIITVKDITYKLSAILSVLNAHCVEPAVIKQVFRQIYYYVGAQMMNNLLLRKDMCHWSRGMQMRFNLSQLEEWARTNQLTDAGLTEALEPIIQATQLLQIDKKSIGDVDDLLSTCGALNTLQVQKILSMYTPANEYEPRVPAKFLRAVAAKGKKTDPSNLMANTQFVYPITFPFKPSSVELTNLALPKEMNLSDVKIL